MLLKDPRGERVTEQTSATAATKAHVVMRTPDVRVVEYVLQLGGIHSWHHHSEIADRFY
jgi:hypothetical protein